MLPSTASARGQLPFASRCNAAVHQYGALCSKHAKQLRRTQTKCAGYHPPPVQQRMLSIPYYNALFNDCVTDRAAALASLAPVDAHSVMRDAYASAHAAERLVLAYRIYIFRITAVVLAVLLVGSLCSSSLPSSATILAPHIMANVAIVSAPAMAAWI